MAVRAFDLTESQSVRLTVVEAAPKRRQDVRRSRQHWLVVGALALAAPFVAAVIAVGVVR
jgi:hypothetical protein